MADQTTKHFVDKDKLIAAVKADVQNAAGVLFVDYTGLTVAEVETFRRKVRAAPGVSYRVIKNTLMARALKDTPAEGAAKFLKGTPTAVIVGHEDPVSTAKLTYEFLKECEHLKVKGGVVDQKPITSKEAETLSKMPSKRELMGQIISLFMSPGATVIGQMKSASGKLVSQIDQFAEKGLDKKV